MLMHNAHAFHTIMSGFGFNVLSDQGLRLDGRRPEEIRVVSCKLGVFSQPDGSAYIEQGNTKVLAAVYGPHEVSHEYLSCNY